jgi:hypothetical protein
MRPSRFITALIVLISVLFMQLAVAAHACPERQITQALMVAHGDSHHHAPCCDGADGTALCETHCAPDSVSLDKAATPDVAPFAAISLSLAGLDPVHPADPGPPPAVDLFPTRIKAPPLSIRHCCFRI